MRPDTTKTRPRMSVAMIVKDEAAQLPGCLACFSDPAIEFCLADTGSSDNTPALARDHGARVELIAWEDDFSAARNTSLEMCAGDWVFIVDADERLADDDVRTLLALCDAIPDTAYRFTTRNYTNASGIAEFVPCAPEDPHARGYAGWFPSAKVRLFPNHRGIGFDGRVHELVNKSLAREGIPIETCEIPVHHYPLDKDAKRLAEKRQLYIRLGEAKILEHPGDARLHAELGNQYCEVGEIGKALKAYKNAVRLEPDNALWMRDLGAALLLAGAYPQAVQALRIAVARDERLEDAWQNLGIAHLHEQQWPEAETALRRALECSDVPGDRHRYLALALDPQGKRSEAVACLKEALTREPRNEQARVLLQSWCP